MWRVSGISLYVTLPDLTESALCTIVAFVCTLGLRGATWADASFGCPLISAGRWAREAVRSLFGRISGRSSSLIARLPNRQSSHALTVHSLVLERSITVVELIFVVEISKLLKVDFVSKHGTDATKALDELITFTGTIGNKF